MNKDLYEVINKISKEMKKWEKEKIRIVNNWEDITNKKRMEYMIRQGCYIWINEKTYYKLPKEFIELLDSKEKIRIKVEDQLKDGEVILYNYKEDIGIGINCNYKIISEKNYWIREDELPIEDSFEEIKRIKCHCYPEKKKNSSFFNLDISF